MGVFRALGGNVDHTIDRIGSPEACSGSADHLNPSDVLEEQVLHVPKNAREERGIDASRISENEKLGRVEAAEPTRAHRPGAGGDPTHVDAGRHPECFGHAGHPRSADLLSADHCHRCRGAGATFLRFGDGSHLDIRQLLQGEIPKVALRDPWADAEHPTRHQGCG
jgi:hypothetical protein